MFLCVIYLLGYIEKVIELESKVEEIKPEVEAFERIVKAKGALNLTTAAKHILVSPENLTSI